MRSRCDNTRRAVCRIAARHSRHARHAEHKGCWRCVEAWQTDFIAVETCRRRKSWRGHHTRLLHDWALDSDVFSHVAGAAHRQIVSSTKPDAEISGESTARSGWTLQHVAQAP